MPTAIPARQMRRPNENARMGDRSHRATCLHMADSEQVMGNSDPQSSRTANTNLSAGGANMSGNATTAAMPAVAVARYDLHTTRLRASDVFRSTTGCRPRWKNANTQA